jgi:ubiquinone/menaquinone biosynthesis C-methylase UbiE
LAPDRKILSPDSEGLTERFLSNQAFTLRNGIFYQKGFTADSFEKVYLHARKLEHRLYPDDIVRTLPDFDGSPPLAAEWKARKASAKILIDWLKQSNARSVLDVGCGNGWLLNQLSMRLSADLAGVDVNETELLQASRLFGHLKICFFLANMLDASLADVRFDAIVFASSLQYFQQPEVALSALTRFLKPRGKIIIVDTPFYKNAKEADQAKRRTEDYYNSIGASDMIGKYYHHTVASMPGLKAKILYDPTTFGRKVIRKFWNKNQPIFPILEIQPS